MSSRLPFATRWAPLLGRFFVVQAAIQVLNLLAGFAVLRTLSKADYALFTIATSAIAAFTYLSNGGVTEAITAVGGGVWEDNHALGALLASAKKIRRTLALWVTIPVVLGIAWILRRNGASSWQIVSIVVLSFATAQWQLSAAIMTVLLRLKKEIDWIQYREFLGAVVRLGVVMIFLRMMDVQIAILSYVVSAYISCLLLWRWIGRNIDTKALPRADMSERLVSIVRRQWFNELYYIFQMQLSVFVLSVFGGANAVADVGALGRIGAIFSVFVALMNTVLLPRFARCRTPEEMRRTYFFIVFSYGSLSLLPFVISMIMPDQILWILGGNYSGLRHPLHLAMLSYGLGSISFIIWGLNSVRGWIMPPWLNIPVAISIQLTLMLLIGVRQLDQVLMVGVMGATTGIIVQFTYTLVFSRRFTRV